MLESPVDNVGNNLHVTVPVRAETASGLDAILVDDAKGPETHVRRVVIIGKRERVP